SGSATFSDETMKAPGWVGNLKVDLPGFGVVPLTGHGVRASMCEGFSCVLHPALPGQSLLRLLARAS
ncbi:MAG TPA: hypothetical protein VHA80_11135, partial [Solirubrobacterales bacterium]|nr:hypothetical protein [Solirubrobacterales bacterium]